MSVHLVTTHCGRRVGSCSHVRWLLLAIAGVVLVVHSLAYNFVTDDAYISFVFSRNLAEHGHAQSPRQVQSDRSCRPPP